jgi:putative component of membrane protein insertase Oxa1/YidC/SpoIIIJ protein YidD
MGREHVWHKEECMDVKYADASHKEKAAKLGLKGVWLCAHRVFGCKVFGKGGSVKSV